MSFCVSRCICCCSVIKWCPTLCDPKDCSPPASSFLQYFLEFSQIHVHRVSDAVNHLILCCPFSCPQSFPASGSFPMSWLFTSDGQSNGASASASVLPMNIQSWFPLGLTGLISLLFMGPSRVFFNTIVLKHQFFDTQPSLWSNSHICTWLPEKL